MPGRGTARSWEVRQMRDREKDTLQEIRYVKLISVGGIDPNAPFSEQTGETQAALLNRCLNSHPRGVIIGRDVSLGRYRIGEHELVMEKVTYHVGFPRKPPWEDAE